MNTKRFSLEDSLRSPPCNNGTMANLMPYGPYDPATGLFDGG